MTNLNNMGQPQVANRAFVALAIEAGIVNVIESLIGMWALDEKSLLIELIDTLTPTNPDLASALNTQTLNAILDYMNTTGIAAVLPADQLPQLLNENGPAVVSAGRDGTTPTQINIGFSEPPGSYTAEIYLDGVYQKDSEATPSGGIVYDILSNVAVDGQAHHVRVLYRNDDGALTRFGPVADFV